MKSHKIDFSKLIGYHYSNQTKMNVLDWMLKTGKKYSYSTSKWNVEGINKSLFSYSANNHDRIYSLPDVEGFDLFFDAIFARAIYAPENKSLKEWRENESISPSKYRMLKFNDNTPIIDESICHHKTTIFMEWLIMDIHNLKGAFLNKKHHHPEFEERTKPKILGISIHTIGNGWSVKYSFSFKEFDYENGWVKSFNQNDEESIFEFLYRTYKTILTTMVDQKY